ncbi:MAG TPA: NYN domain-containing protein [Ktedonobacteraceae bacterium]|nr:NYN domain-containing protein [Ktedonobacteraceae bacterium]
MKQARAIVLIDGSNFYFKLKDLGFSHLLNFDFSGFATLLAGSDRLIQATYYIGAVRTDGTEKTKKLLADQQRLFVHLKKHHFAYSLGYLLRSKGVFHEKGVDVKIAVDMLVAAYENLCDRIILVSSDTDLIPAIEKAREKRKTVEYIGFSHQLSFAMKRECSKTHILAKKDLMPLMLS